MPEPKTPQKFPPDVLKVLDKFAQEAEYKDWADLERSEFMWYPDTHERLATLAFEAGREFESKKSEVKR